MFESSTSGIVINLLFLDTEFTNFSNPELISIGLASSNGENFYAEAYYTDSSCSDFVREVVIPLLSRTDQISCEHLRLKILRWLDSIRGTNPIVICYDSDYDRILLLKLLKNNPPSYLFFRSLGYRHINGFKRAAFYVKNNLDEHHALNDAMSLRYAFRGWTRNVR